ncbi:interferon-inducible double-stranded RNA-dependent protein kinase activator A homolog isoform X2 [Trichogramma pretiosum]|uniref:interferon-inducible double-stranded RNA-dependent protein kinase activator A homolog isoform X2 n=1 Tax=Trichogramma pretiosum TaxID=7493 RepID=UPI0006C9904E|nr:interferon-inducible double-stranded RNA-dependent protein kinase activator A homolog isoform X2 [Trichogramma pretiosum]
MMLYHDENGSINDISPSSDNNSMKMVPMSQPTTFNRRPKIKANMHALMCEALPLDEAARLEMKALPSKTPVSVLQELLSRRGTTPKYELVQIEGAIHEPTFRYRVTVADVVAVGTGRSKKEAKHAAAKAVLDKLIGVSTENPEAPIPNSISDAQGMQDMQSSFGDDKIANNPIGSLQELCMSRHWPPPRYSMQGEEGLPHEREFTIICHILQFEQVGQGKSKKLAKRQAAHKMWLALQDTSSLTVAEETKDKSLNHDVINLVQFLQEIALEQKFEVTYVDIEERSKTGKCQCLVQLSTLPVAVCYGSGRTSNDAQAAAAQNALEYLKIMTKK